MQGLSRLFCSENKPQVAGQPHGIESIGNTSYLSSVLQALTSSLRFIDVLTSGETTFINGPITQVLRRFIKVQRKAGYNETISAYFVLEVLQRHQYKFSEDYVHDVAEILEAFIDGILAEASSTGPLVEDGQPQKGQRRVTGRNNSPCSPGVPVNILDTALRRSSTLLRPMNSAFRDNGPVSASAGASS
eukprot:IDg16435t1